MSVTTWGSKLAHWIRVDEDHLIALCSATRVSKHAATPDARASPKCFTSLCAGVVELARLRAAVDNIQEKHDLLSHLSYDDGSSP